MLVTFAFVLIIAGVMRKVYGAATRTVEVPPFLQGGIDVLDGAIPDVPVLLHGRAVAVAVHSGPCCTGPVTAARSGPRSRPGLLGLSGVNVRALFTAVFVIAAFFAGCRSGGRSRARPGPGIAVDTIILAFVVVVIGGLGSISGAFIAAFLVGIAEAVGILWVPSASLAIVFPVLVIVLAVRPQGIMGHKA